MNLGDIWQEHKRFITIVAIGGTVMLLAYAIISSIYSGKVDLLQRDIERAQKVQRDAALPPGIEIKKIQAAREELVKEFDGLTQAVAHVPTEYFRLGSTVTDPDLHYNAQVDRIRTGILELAAIRNIDVDQRLGLPEAFPASRAEIEHYLKGLDVVEELLSFAVAAEQLYEGGIARVERIEIEKFAKGRASDRKIPFVNGMRIGCVVVGHPQAIDWVLRRFTTNPNGEPSRAGRYLAIDESSIRSLDVSPSSQVKEKRGVDPLDRRRVELRLSVLALDINREGQVR